MKKILLVAMFLTVALCSALAAPAQAYNAMRIEVAETTDPQNNPRIKVSVYYHIDNLGGNQAYTAVVNSGILRYPYDGRGDTSGTASQTVEVPAYGFADGSFQYFSENMYLPYTKYFCRTFIYQATYPYAKLQITPIQTTNPHPFATNSSPNGYDVDTTDFMLYLNGQLY